jgi:hypothetical protein
MNRFLSSLLRPLLLVPALLLAAGCVHDHFTDDDWCGRDRHDHDCDDRITRTFDEVDFDEIEIHSAFRLTVRQSDEFRVRISVPERSVDDIEVRRSGSRLRLSMDHGFLDGEARAVVELPLLRHVQAHDASEVRLQRIESPGTVNIRLEDASRIEGELDAERTVVDLKSASRANLDGRTDELELDISSTSEAQLRDLPCRRADVKLSSISSATIDVSERLDVTASGLSVLHYYGDPHLGRVDTSSGGHIEHEH